VNSSAHLALKLQAGLGDVHGERGTLREHGRGASQAELLGEARNASARVSATHRRRHGCFLGVEGCFDGIKTTRPISEMLFSWMDAARKNYVEGEDKKAT